MKKNSSDGVHSETFNKEIAILDSNSNEPLTINQSSRFWINNFSGVDPELVRRLGSTTDVAVLRNRGLSSFANFLYGSTVLSLGGDAVFGTPGWFNPMFVGVGVGIGFLNLCMDRFLTLRGLYHAGKRDLVRSGIPLDVGAEEISWYSALAVRTGAAAAYSVIVGTVVCQTVLGSAAVGQLEKGAAEGKAMLIARHAKVIDARVDAAHELAKHDADDIANIRKLLADLQRQDVINTQQAARQTAKQQVRSGLEGTRQLTSTNLQVYETKTTAAEKKAASSEKVYADLARDRNGTLNKDLLNDPEYIPAARDPLSKLVALRELAGQNHFVAAGIIIVELLGVCLEFWVVVLAFAQCPTRLASTLYFEFLKHTTTVARDLARPINASASKSGEPDEQVKQNSVSHQPDGQETVATSEMPAVAGAQVANSGIDGQTPEANTPEPSTPLAADAGPRRKRGRPRKNGFDVTAVGTTYRPASTTKDSDV